MAEGPIDMTSLDKLNLSPLAYHRRVADALASKEKELWDWFQSDKFAEQHEREARLRLDKSAIRLGRDGNANNTRRYELADTARDKLGLTADIVLYQSQNSGGAPNAMLHYIPGQITVEFVGRILELLDERGTARPARPRDRPLQALPGGRSALSHGRAPGSLDCPRDDCPRVWFETARRLSLYTEVYCDTAGYIVTGSRDASIRGLAKIIADFKDADAKTYLAQAETILAQEKTARRDFRIPSSTFVPRPSPIAKRSMPTHSRPRWCRLSKVRSISTLWTSSVSSARGAHAGAD